MTLWDSFVVPYLYETRLEDIQLSDMTSLIMEGMDEKNRPYLAMRVLYEGQQRIGFIIQKYSHRNDEWEYGVLEHLDVYQLSKEACVYMNLHSNRLGQTI